MPEKLILSLQDFNAAAIAATDHCGYLHPGDIPHHLFNGNQKYDPAEVMTIWEDDQGVAAWLLAALEQAVPDDKERALISGRSIVVKKLKALPIEAIVRGYIIGSGWKDYQSSGSS